MRRLAAEVYHLHPSKDAKDLQRWSSHSIRVGACVVLHAMGFSDTDIQWILRWRSLAFTACLRNIAILATRPKVTEGKFTRADIEEKRSNLLFFGNFYNSFKK